MPKEFHVTQWCGDRTVEWLRNGRPQNSPFFLFSSFIKPHVPYDCPEHLVDLYDPDDMPLPWRSGNEASRKNPIYAQQRKHQEWDLYSEKSARRAKAYYYANITFIDEQIGRILDELDNQGLTDNTLVVFSADHGDMMGDHDMWYKSFGYEGSMHIPLLMRWPGKIAPGTTVDDIATLLDLFPTFMNAGGVDSPEKRPGRDLITLVEGTESRDVFFSEYGSGQNYNVYIRHKEWKYMFFANGGFEELYNLIEDPRELNDLAEDGHYRKELERMREAAKALISRYSDSETLLDDNGHLRRTSTYTGPTALPKKYNRNTRPYSRMPWDSRTPANALAEQDTPWWWQEVGGDWSQLIEYAKNKKHTFDEQCFVKVRLTG